MTPLQMIKEGVLKKDFGLVSQGYATLTGEIIVAPPDAEITERIKQAPHPIPKKTGHGFDMADFHMKIVDENRRDGDGRIPYKSEPVNVDKIKTVGNLFKDVKDIATEDIEFDKKVHVKLPTERVRQEAPKLQKFTCAEKGCKSTAMLNPNTVPCSAESDYKTPRYVCPQCIQNKMKRG